MNSSAPNALPEGECTMPLSVMVASGSEEERCRMGVKRQISSWSNSLGSMMSEMRLSVRAGAGGVTSASNGESNGEVGDVGLVGGLE